MVSPHQHFHHVEGPHTRHCESFRASYIVVLQPPYGTSYSEYEDTRASVDATAEDENEKIWGSW